MKIAGQEVATRPDDWVPMYTGPHPKIDGTYFTIRWFYPFTMNLANRKTITFDSYKEHSHFVREVSEHFKKTDHIHPFFNS